MKISGIQNLSVPRAQLHDQIKNGHVSQTNYNLSFGEDKKSETKEDKKGFSLKKITNVLGVIGWVGIVGIATKHLFIDRPPYQRLLGADKTFTTRINNAKENCEYALLKAKGEANEGNFLYRVGYKLNGMKEKIGEELFNNILYGIGTVAIMPAVIMWMPFGKKNSSKEDKKYAVLRQPLSFGTMFAIQLTNDKLFKIWNKNIIDQNLAEDKSILDKDGKFLKNAEGKISDDVLDKIKYNPAPLKEKFKDECKKYKFVMTDTEEKTFFNIKDPKLQINELKKMIGEKIKSTDIKNAEESLVKSFSRYSAVSGKGKLASEVVKITNNVIISQVIGCTALNVIYGKMMKRAESKKQLKENINKAVQIANNDKEMEVK